MKSIAVLTGPTAVGKTFYSLGLAKALDGEIVSCDSIQLYRYMDIGSAKPSKEEMGQIKHHLIDAVDPRDSFSAAQYQGMAKKAIGDILGRGKLPIVTGGTGLYLNSLLYDMDFGPVPTDRGFRRSLFVLLEEKGKEALYERLLRVDPAAAERIHPNNVKRVIRALEAIEKGEEPLRDFNQMMKKTENYQVILMGLNRPRNQLYQRINRRVDILMEKGLVQEVKSLLSMGLTEEHISMKGIGYKELIDYHLGRRDLDEAVEQIKKNTRHYAKRQLTWFKRYEEMKWFHLDQYDGEEEALEDITQWVKAKR